ncbi:hypothetical protein QTN25_002266 [Entamoeba marina]
MSKVNVVMYGDAKTGKTSFIKAIVDKSFDDDYIATDQQQIEYNMVIKNTPIEVCFIDVGGKVFQKKTITVSTHASNGPIHVFIISKDSPKSLEFVQHYIEEEEYSTVPHDVIAFVVNKMDYNGNDKLVEEAKRLAKLNKGVYIETSCKTETDAVTKLSEEIIEPYMRKNKLFNVSEKQSSCCALL